MARKAISASVRWSVFARDSFACRYCGSQAGQEGVELAIDHVISVADGGDNRIDNLVTACKKCNGGKSARSLKNAPTSAEVVSRIHERTSTLHQQAAAMAASIKANADLEQMAINLKCTAYDQDTCKFERGESGHIIRLCQVYGADQVSEWYRAAYSHNVPERRAIKYVYGIVRRLKEGT